MDTGNFTMNKFSFKSLMVALALLVNMSFAEPPMLVEPPYNAVNRHHANMMTGQIQVTHDDVSIGGSLGLKHSVSTFSSSFVGADDWPIGPSDKYEGRLYTVVRNPNAGNGIAADLRRWIVANDGSDTQYFDAGNSETTPIPGANGYFPPINDKRYTLRLDSTLGMVMTKPDGTQVLFPLPVSFQFDRSYNMSKIIYPNGQTIEVDLYTDREPETVTTNTGFQLRYYYVPDTRPLDPSLASQNKDKLVSSTGWWGLNPKYVVGINQARIYCPYSGSAQNNYNWVGSDLSASSCDVASGKWPKAEYIWPAGMPRRMYLAQGTFSVINPDGSQTDYVHNPISKCGSYYPCPSEQFSYIRLTSIKPANSNVKTNSFGYTNTGTWIKYGMSGYWTSKGFAVLTKSTGGEGDNSDEILYDINKIREISGTPAIGINWSGGVKSINEVQYSIASNQNSGKPYSIDAWDYYATFYYPEGDVKTFLDRADSSNSEYSYDSRGNVTSIISKGGTQTASYPSQCDLPTNVSGNYKYCNKPAYITDRKNNRTDMTYHQPSGQIETVTYPADSRGIRKVVRYYYQQYYAKVLNSYSGSKTQLADGIWLLYQEKTCTNSAMSSDTCTGSDAVVTNYEYLHDNLLMTGTTLYSQRENKTLRTCYYYDKYGNQIGKTEPKAGLTSCAQ